jgi:hypothetical protein
VARACRLALPWPILQGSFAKKLCKCKCRLMYQTIVDVCGKTCDLYYKHITIISDASRVISE